MNLPSAEAAVQRFSPGRLLATPAAVQALADANVSFNNLLSRHIHGDWGELSEFDREQNELSINTGRRILSSYVLPNQQTVWLITEANRSVTTFLLPGDY